MAKSLRDEERIALLKIIERDPVDWSELNFYIEDSCDPITGEEFGPGPIRLAPFQKRIIRAALARDDHDRFLWNTVVYSAVKKSGKTRLSAMVASWLAVTHGPYAEIYLAANDGSQSEDRLLSAVKKAVKISPALTDWRPVRGTVLLPDGSFIEAIPVDPTGEAGANPTGVFFCFDEGTEILTKNGWRTWNTLSMNDDIATRGPDGEFEWQLPLAIHCSYYEGLMWSGENKSCSILVTPGHKLHGDCLTSKGKVTCSGLIPVEEVINHHYFRPTMTATSWEGNELSKFVLPATQRRPELLLDPLLFARFMGWFLSEGSISKKRGKPEGTLIGQSEKANPKYRKEIINLIQELGFCPREWADKINIAIWDVRLAAYCNQFGLSGDKYIPQWIKDAPTYYLDAFLDAYNKGDGTSLGGHTFVISTKSAQMIDDLMEIGQKLGYRLHTYTQADHRWGESPCIIYSVVFSSSGKRPRVQNWRQVDYAGYVYCPSTLNGVVLVRRDGSCYWNGQSELWGYGVKHKQRLFTEMTLSPVRRGKSIRWVDTYAGYEGESPTLKNLYVQTVEEGERHPSFPDYPVYINRAARIFCYWDHEPRMPWQLGELGKAYYAHEEATLLPLEFLRLHKNQWVASSESFIDPIQWEKCREDNLVFDPLEPMVLAMDAATSDDCFAIIGVSRHPDSTRAETDIATRYVGVWRAPKGGKIDFSEPEETVRELHSDYNVVATVYDEYQLHDMITRLRKEAVGYFKPFPQMGKRIEADTALRRLILRRGVAHDGNSDLTKHICNAAAKLDGNDKRLRLVKKSPEKKIDAAVTLSMAAYECLRLNL